MISEFILASFLQKISIMCVSFLQTNFGIYSGPSIFPISSQNDRLLDPRSDPFSVQGVPGGVGSTLPRPPVERTSAQEAPTGAPRVHQLPFGMILACYQGRFWWILNISLERCWPFFFLRFAFLVWELVQQKIRHLDPNAACPWGGPWGPEVGSLGPGILNDSILMSFFGFLINHKHNFRPV